MKSGDRRCHADCISSNKQHERRRAADKLGRKRRIVTTPIFNLSGVELLINSLEDLKLRISAFTRC